MEQKPLSNETADTKKSSQLPQALFLPYITDLVFALFVFFLIFRLPSLALYRWSNSADTAPSNVGLRYVSLLFMSFGILWCVAFALKSTEAFLKNLLQSSD